MPSRAQLILQGSAPRAAANATSGRSPRLSRWRRPWSPSAPSVSVFYGDAGPEVALTCPSWAWLGSCARSSPCCRCFCAPWSPPRISSRSLLVPLAGAQLVALCILRYPKQFLELLGLFIAHFREPASLLAGARRCFLRLYVCFSGLLVGSGGFSASSAARRYSSSACLARRSKS